MIDIITIDGPASSGKGTVAKIVAQKLGFNYLDSGAIYRSVAFSVCQKQLSINDISAILNLIKYDLHLIFKENKVFLNDIDVTTDIRQEEMGNLASKLSKNAEIRSCLLAFQREFAISPGLVTDGRDMGSVVFTEAVLKVFLTASVEVRAERRLKQLQLTDRSAIIAPILRDIILRDKQDSLRKVAPLGYDGTYKLLDSTTLDVSETVEQIIKWYHMVK